MVTVMVIVSSVIVIVMITLILRVLCRASLNFSASAQTFVQSVATRGCLDRMTS